MVKYRDNGGDIVFSTKNNGTCPQCGKEERKCKCFSKDNKGKNTPPSDGIVRLSRETKGRKGAGVTLITGVPLSENELKELAKELKKKCGVGGALKDGVIEVQGEQRERLKPLLESKGFKVKISGG